MWRRRSRWFAVLDCALPFGYVVDGGYFEDFSNYEKKLKAELKKDGCNRKAAILLARLYAELQKSRDKAIQVLDGFIKAKLANGAKPDSDVADAYWNIANYFEEEYRESGNADATLRTKAIEAAGRSIAIVPGYLKNLWEDDDFKDLRESEEAKKKLPPYQG